MNLIPSIPLSAGPAFAGSSHRKSRSLWSLCGLLLAILVSFALPGQRIQLGAAQLQGLVGSYTGHGNWLITVTYAGSATWQLNHSPIVQYGELWEWVNGQHYDMCNVDLSKMPQVITDSGGASSGTDIKVWVATMKGSADAHLNLSGASINYNITWSPSLDNIAEPSPKKIILYYRRKVTVTGGGGANISGSSATSASASYSALGSIGSIGDNTADQFTAPPNSSGSNNNPTKYDNPFIREELDSTSGAVSKTFSLSGSVNAASDVEGWISTGVSGIAEVNLGVDLCIAGFDLARFGGPLRATGGGNRTGSTDPTYTRWLPLAFSPQVTSQPFRYQAGALPGPWGNINCMYSPALRQEPDTPNYDLDGRALEYVPSLDGSGSFNNPGPPFTVMPSGFTPRYSLTDANGDRLLFLADWTPYGNIHSTLTNLGNGLYQLSNAGPPGAMREKGDYTYTFQKTSIYSQPLNTRLVSLKDSLNNTQSLNWTANNAMIVMDSSSGRSLVFNAGTNGYFGSVDAPEIGSGVHTHTTLTWDANGHATAINVYAGNSTTLLHSDTFGYGGPNGDSVTSAQRGVSTLSYTYASDSLTPDPFGLFTPRLASATSGSSTDSSSSDDGGSVAGTVSYTYGPTQKGYTYWGVDAHTNTVTDARGTLFSTIFQISNDVEGDLIGMTYTGPAFTGSASVNKVRATYSPNMDQPQSISVFDQLYYAGQSTQPWQATLDLLGNLTQITDPLNNSWQFGYTADGKYLAGITDPTNISVGFAYGERNNPASRLTTLSSPAAGTTQIDYNTFGQPTVFTMPSAAGQVQSTLAYDNTTGDLLSVTGPLGDVLRTTGYDALGDPLGAAFYPDTGNPATSTQPLVTSITYDAAQMPISIAGPNGVSLNTTFTNGIMSQFTLLNQGQTLGQMTLSRDTRGRVYQASDSVGTLAGYRYDKNSNVTRILDGAGNSTQFVYGSNNEPTSMTWPDGHGTSAAYDAVGRTRQTTDERGLVCNYVYDNAHRLTDMQFPNSSADNVHYTYDNAGRLLMVGDATGSRAYEYDTAGRLDQVTTIYAALPAGHNTFVIGYTYYGDGSVATMTSPLGTTHYQYNAAGEMTQSTDPHGSSTSYSFDHIGRRTGQTTTQAGGQTLSTTYAWGVSGLAGDLSTLPCYLRQIQQSVGSQTWTYTLTHSQLGQLLRQDDATSQSNVNGYELFAYDGRGRLSSENLHWQSGAQANYTLSSGYSFDAANNVQALGGWTVNSSNQVTSAPYVAASAGLAGATGLSYDVAGNTHTLNGATLNYDVWGNLNSLSLPGGPAVSYVYDSSGRRIRKTVGTSSTYCHRHVYNFQIGKVKVST